MINRFKEAMLAIDPEYGSKEHQREFLRRYDERQTVAPCPTDHVHENACYAINKRDGSFYSFGIK